MDVYWTWRKNLVGVVNINTKGNLNTLGTGDADLRF